MFFQKLLKNHLAKITHVLTSCSEIAEDVEHDMAADSLSLAATSLTADTLKLTPSSASAEETHMAKTNSIAKP